MQENRWWCRVETVDFGGHQSMELAHVNSDGTVGLPERVIFKIVQDPGLSMEIRPPFLTDKILRPTGKAEMFQAMLDGLWQAGYRPSEGLPPGGEIHRMEDHIIDLRRIAFKALGVKP